MAGVGASIMASYKPKLPKASKLKMSKVHITQTNPKIKPVKIKSHKMKP
jgi:hypothetical protein